MRMLAALLATAMVLGSTGGADARDRRKGERKSVAAERAEQGGSRRASTVDRSGVCVRDNGRPFHRLDLNHRCDREEFWARFNDYGDSRN